MFVPAAAIEFMEPALRIAQSLQLSRYGWDYQVPDEQRALLEQVAPRAIREPSMHVDALKRDAARRRKA
jgi:hemoglobin